MDQVAVRGDALRYYFSLSYNNNNVLDQNSLMMIMYSFRQYCFLSVADVNMRAQVIELNLLTNHASYEVFCVTNCNRYFPMNWKSSFK